MQKRTPVNVNPPVVPDMMAELVERPSLALWEIGESEPRGFEPWSSQTDTYHKQCTRYKAKYRVR